MGQNVVFRTYETKAWDNPVTEIGQSLFVVLKDSGFSFPELVFGVVLKH